MTFYEQDITSSNLEQQVFFVIANGAIENNILNNILSGVQNGGFLLTIERQFDSKFRQIGLDVIAKYSDGQNVYVLLKKVTITINIIMIITSYDVLFIIKFRILKYLLQL